jgi:CHAT domain-containing protein
MVDRLAQTAPDWSLRTQPDPDKLAQLVHGDPDHTRIMSRADATEAALRERLPSADLIHLATPFRINGASPLFSPLLLAPDTANDGALEAREVMNLDLHARLAILSDGGAMSLRDAADEAAAVAWAWRAAGVPAIIMPRWTSEDQSADDLLAELHARLRAGDAPEVALQAASAKLRAKPGAAPLSWAAWMLIVGR